MMKMKVVSSVKKPTTRIERGKKERVNCGLKSLLLFFFFFFYFYFYFYFIFDSFSLFQKK